MTDKPIEDHPYHDLDDGRLLYIIQDAGRAAQAMRGHNFTAECKYLDQVNDACTVLHYRRKLRERCVKLHNEGVLATIHKLNSGE